MRLTLARRILISSLKANNKVVSPVAAAAADSAQQPSNVTINNNGERVLRKIDLSKDLDKLPPEQKIYIEKLMQKNMDRFAAQKRLRRHYLITGSILTAFVLTIYFYTIYSIKQEKFLDDFDVPEPPDPAVRGFKKE